MKFAKILKNIFNEVFANGCSCKLPGYYITRKKFAYTCFIAHYVKSIKIKEMVLIRLEIQNKFIYNF